MATTHVFIVDNNTFKTHLEYLFVGTGAKDKLVDFNDSETTEHYGGGRSKSEIGLVAMMADGCRMRAGDYVIFYLQATISAEGKFYGIFKIEDDCIFLDDAKTIKDQYLFNQLRKNLTFRQLIKPYEVYAEGVTEWEALDDIRNIPAPFQMLWSLIYRKLKGNRGNTMITIYEADRLFDLIRIKNDHNKLISSYFSFDGNNIVKSEILHKYGSEGTVIKILPRLIYKYNHNQAFEAHLQMYITQNLGRGTNKSLDNALGINAGNIEWIGNEVSCGVGMQRIDIMISKILTPAERILMPIELKSVPASVGNIKQIKRYIEWIEQYYVPNRPSSIRPVLICKGNLDLQQDIIDDFQNFNRVSNGRYLPLLFIEYCVENNCLKFSEKKY